MKWYISEGSDKEGDYYRYTTWPETVVADDLDGLTLAKALKVLEKKYEVVKNPVKGRHVTIIARKKRTDKL